MSLRGLRFYTVNEVAEIMQVRVETVLRWIYAKKLKASKLPGSRLWRIKESDIEDFMTRGENVFGFDDEAIDIETEIVSALEETKVDMPVNTRARATEDKPIIERKANGLFSMVFDEELASQEPDEVIEILLPDDEEETDIIQK